jgi:hypothetical protein
LGRWIQPDSVVPLSKQGPQAFDRYAYVNNSPLQYTDPSGYDYELWYFDKYGKLPPERENNSSKYDDELEKIKDDESSFVEITIEGKTFQSMEEVYEYLEYCKSNPFSCNMVNRPISVSILKYQQGYFAGYKVIINWSDMDWEGAIASVVGIIGEAANVSIVGGDVVGPFIFEVTNLVEVLSVIKNISVAFLKGDPSGLTMDTLEFNAKNAFQGVGGYPAPVIGIFCEIINIAMSVWPGISIIEVYRPRAQPVYNKNP